ncbi:helix-turn-helix transcriptional regulator [Mycobacterium spongiae]|uniref:LuxR family transcriptional regulator n=1 Tax=Mycobacterium spongiae TaxID=886343 RepID=A0A975JWT3_9MYCO|nr:LuxR C-terminal-related transcriptional regulator [Mycobacterium spongiae]QUR67134.1 LuxR family transcriptional regulator [Mycobacterium spongiae]
MTESLPTGTVTFLLGDVDGSTRLRRTQPDKLVAAGARLDQMLAEFVAVHGGVRVVERAEDDGFVVAFARASDAVACALRLQQARLAPIRLRIGVHTGQVRVRDEAGYAGPTINRTKLLRDLAHGGQTLLSGVTEQLVVDWLPADVWLTDLGAHQLGDLPRPERVGQLCHPSLSNKFPPLRTTGKSVDTHNVPVHLTSFVGRATQITQLRELLADNRLVTLTGAGGVGKTRLGAELAVRIAPEFGDGAWYVDLATTTDPALVSVAVARALGLSDRPGMTTREVLVQFVGGRHMLMVLDNCEHLLAASASVAVDLLDADSGLTVLTTSREPLGVAGEVTFMVPSLSLADEAVELFADRARRVRPDFEVIEDNEEAVVEICRRLDGIPLAIELAAARAGALSLAEILGSLDDRFGLLTSGARTALPRQQTLRASVDWSYALLTEYERTVLRRLSVFVGGFDLDAARAVAASTLIEGHQIFDQLVSLVDKSLVVADSAGASTRYRLLETVRQYALEKLVESGEADDVRNRHRDYYTSLAASLLDPGCGDYEQRLGHAWDEMDDFRGAFGRSLETGAIGRALELASSLEPLWQSHGGIREGLAWLETALADIDAPTVTPEVRVQALASRATLLAWVGVAASVTETEEALAVARSLDDRVSLVRALMARGCASLYDAEAAGPYFAEAVSVAREIGDSWLLSQALVRQTTPAVIAGDLAATVKAAAKALDAAEATGDRFAARHCRLLEGFAIFLQGDLETGYARLAHVIEEATAEHDAMFRVYGLVIGGYVRALQGDAVGAQGCADAALESCAELLGFHTGTANAGVAVACLAAGDADAAWQAYEAARTRTGLEPLTNGLFVWAALGPLGCGDLAAARRWADDVVLATEGSFEAASLSTRSRVAIAQHDLRQAESDAYDALAIASRLPSSLIVPDVFECLADLACDVGNHRDAARLCGAADTARRGMGTVRFKVLDESHQATVGAVREALGNNEFDSAWAEGAALSTSDAIAYAQRGRGERNRPTRGWASLTPTEARVVRLVSEGLTNKDIATQLFISYRTVQTHLTHVYAKLGLNSRLQLAQQAARRV